jgi:hypothetical protein
MGFLSTGFGEVVDAQAAQRSLACGRVTHWPAVVGYQGKSRMKLRPITLLNAKKKTRQVLQHLLRKRPIKH